ncbi:DNA-binding transcriptional activator FeaR [compost metagenome]
MTTAGHKPRMGILQLNEGEKKYQLERYAPSEKLRPFVKHYWVVRWSLEGQEPYSQDVVPGPCVNMVMEANRSVIYGVASRKYTKLIEGEGQVFGIKFLPGGFYPFLQSPLSELTDRSLELRTLFGEEAEAYEQAVSSELEISRIIDLTEALLLRKQPAADEAVAAINRMIHRMHEDRELTKVEQLCEAFSLNKRKLQRLFSQYVGVSPKWVLKLYRLQNAAEGMETGRVRDWIKLSQDLGYYDQSHFIRDFKAMIGRTPDEYARLCEK